MRRSQRVSPRLTNAQNTLLSIGRRAELTAAARLAAAERLGESGWRVLEDGRTEKWRCNPDRIERPDR